MTTAGCRLFADGDAVVGGIALVHLVADACRAEWAAATATGRLGRA